MTGFTAAAALTALVALAVAAAYGAGRLLELCPFPFTATPFTGGVPPVEHAVSRYHARWYALTMLYLAFEQEMLFMFPWTKVISVMGPSAVIEMFTFLAILLAGAAYAWREGALRWA